MNLQSISIISFRSIKSKVEFHLDPRVTVVIGANDHGKSNLLASALLLNHDASTTLDDINWDAQHNGNACEISYKFELDTIEIETVKDLMARFRKAALRMEIIEYSEELSSQQAEIDEAAVALQVAKDAHTTTEKQLADAKSRLKSNPTGPQERAAIEQIQNALAVAKSEVDKAAAFLDQIKNPFEAIISKTIASHPARKATGDTPKSISCVRTFKEDGSSDIAWHVPAGVDDDLFLQFIDDNYPRAESIQAFDSISDSTTLEELEDGSNEFMKGIFYYAGLKPEDWPTLFEQNNRSTRRLATASDKLNTELKRTWSQGADLLFKLQHDSKNDSINLMVEDPSVTGQYVHASRRSSGFTHYFTLKCILHARQTENPAKSHIWLFDEPGIYLHPSGQHDLIHELESLGRRNQVVYTTHSLFMINKNYPTRHRLVTKSSEGTLVSSKPYSGRWKNVISSLGMHHTGTLLFASTIVIVEGDSDPIILSACLQKLIEASHSNIDLNSVSIIPASTSADSRNLITILSESSPTPKLAVLVDGDKGGSLRLKAIEDLVSRLAIATHKLTDGTSIEDHAIDAGNLYLDAAASLMEHLRADGNDKIPSDVREKMIAQYQKESDRNKTSVGIAKWVQDYLLQAANINSVSKVGIARQYATLLQSHPAELIRPNQSARMKKIADWLIQEVGVPRLDDDVTLKVLK
jgi:predicted ATP-dependent endonuclease of OLD family